MPYWSINVAAFFHSEISVNSIKHFPLCLGESKKAFRLLGIKTQTEVVSNKGGGDISGRVSQQFASATWLSQSVPTNFTLSFLYQVYPSPFLVDMWIELFGYLFLSKQLITIVVVTMLLWHNKNFSSIQLIAVMNVCTMQHTWDTWPEQIKWHLKISTIHCNSLHKPVEWYWSNNIGNAFSYYASCIVRCLCWIRCKYIHK